MRKITCKNCRSKFRPPARGRRPRYCSASCRQKAYLNRKGVPAIVLLAQDLASVRVQAMLRGMIREELVRAGILEPPAPSAKTPTTKPRAHLRVVKE